MHIKTSFSDFRNFNSEFRLNTLLHWGEMQYSQFDEQMHEWNGYHTQKGWAQPWQVFTATITSTSVRTITRWTVAIGMCAWLTVYRLTVSDCCLVEPWVTFLFDSCLLAPCLLVQLHWTEGHGCMLLHRPWAGLNTDFSCLWESSKGLILLLPPLALLFLPSISPSTYFQNAKK